MIRREPVSFSSRHKDFNDKINKGYVKKRKLIETKKETKFAKIKNEVRKEDFAELLNKAQIGKPSTLLNIYNFFYNFLVNLNTIKHSSHNFVFFFYSDIIFFCILATYLFSL